MTMHTFPFQCLSAVVLALLLAGCNTPPADEATPAAPAPTPESIVTAPAPTLPQGWRFIAGTQPPSVPKAAQRLPTTVRSDDGVDIAVADSSRTIAGGDDVIVLMEALGLADQVHAAPLRSATRAGARAPRQFLFNRNTGAEGVLSLDATLFLGNSLRRHAHSGLAGKLRDAGLPAVVIDDLQPIPDKVRKTAAALGLSEQGQALAEQVQAQLDEAARIAASHARRPRILHVSASGAGGRPTVGGADNAASNLIRLAGGINVGDEAGVANYSELSREGIVASNPDIVLLSENDLELFGGEEGLWNAYPTLRLTPAGRANRVWVMPDVQLKAASLASGTGAVALARAIAEFVGDGAR